MVVVVSAKGDRVNLYRWTEALILSEMLYNGFNLINLISINIIILLIINCIINNIINIMF